MISTAFEIVITNWRCLGVWYWHRRRAVLRVTLHHDRVERQRQILEMRAVVWPGIDANDIVFPHVRVLLESSAVPVVTSVHDRTQNYAIAGGRE